MSGRPSAPDLVARPQIRPAVQIRPDPPDQEARLRTREDLQRNLLVEAGAGSGKTTSLVDRMVALVRSQACTVKQIAAVTFTRKAAAELRQRFQVVLEGVLSGMAPDDPDFEVLETAIRDIDNAFLGTIHAFCAKLLRERPLEAGLDPGFREVQESEAYRMQRKSWVEFLERMGADGDPRLEELERLGIAPDRLQGVFETLVENPDVDFGFGRVAPPDDDEIGKVRARFNELLDRAEWMMRDRDPPEGWEPFGRRCRTLLYWRRALNWNDRAVFFDALAKVHLSKTKPTQKRWADTRSGKAEAKRLGEDFREFGAEGGLADKVLTEWWAYRYPVAIGVAKSAADAFAEQRKRRGDINFQDLLVLTAALLREDDGARRDLGERYPRVLVDEFQDTDPLQAEILLLLASNPDAGNDWREVVPRPGALFVVGDPKQSIYRFRRADIALYEFVKNRFEAFGDVLRLDANFRSLGAIEALVKGVFDHPERFAREDSDRQAAFAPLMTQRWPGRDGPGVLATYEVVGTKQADVAGDDAGRIASAIARRVEAGKREPGDFMILTRNRKFLSVYARALEDRNLPVEVSGAGVGFEDELAALLLLFRCLADPAHKVRVLGVLAGPLFGITLDRLVAYKDAKGSLTINEEPRGEGEVADAIGVLHEWWKRARREPSDVTAERLVRETGLFPLAAAGTLGELRAGALVYLLDAVRARALEGDTSLAGAVDAMETALAWEDAEAQLVPGRPNCVQVMNLHRAKGLEAPVVFLAAPFGDKDWAPSMRVSRDEEGMARGTIPIVEQARFRKDVIAQPATWERDQNEEAEFEKAEKVRLLYVAATRAKDELWIAQGRGLPRWMKSPWEPVERWVNAEAGVGVAEVARVAELPHDLPPEADMLDPETDVAVATAAVAEAADRTRTPTYRLDTVTARAKGEAVPRGDVAADAEVASSASPGGGVASPEGATGADAPPVHTAAFARPPLRPASGGFEWGSVVHAVLSAAGEGAHGKPLAQLARDLLIEFERPVDAKGAPTELEALLALVDSVRGSEVWNRAMASPERHTEVPFAVSMGGAADGAGATKSAGTTERAGATEGAGAPERREVLEGVIDLVFKDGDRWVVADYKTDRGDDPNFNERLGQYRVQVDLYAQCWEKLTGEQVGERVLVFTAQGRSESW